MIKARVEVLRGLMKKYGLDAYLVPGTDPHQNEYIPDFWQRRKYISGFKGSAGDVVITRSKAGLWTDSRYFLQAEHELDKRNYQLFKMGMPEVPGIKEWIVQELAYGETLGVDPQLLTHKSYRDLHTHLKTKGIRLKAVSRNLVDAVWDDRPVPAKEKIHLHPIRYAGESATIKLARIRNIMKEISADLLVLSSLDEIAWLFNIRGNDIKYNPVVISYALITGDEAMLFIDPDKLTRKCSHTLKKVVEFHDYDRFYPILREIAKRHELAWIDETRVSQHIVNSLKKHIKIHSSPGPIPQVKAIKNKTEIQGFRSAHIRDGIAMVKFLCWLHRSPKKGDITELSAAAKLAEFRAANSLFRGPSFQTISACNEHSAIVHYGASPDTDKPLHRTDIYLIDSGAQYDDATTDITRTVCLGRPRSRQKMCFTRVLKGLIALSSTSFPMGTPGRQLDTIARLPLWKYGQNYGHGTGHGIGTYLNVHEGPHAISPDRCPGVPLEPGMITTIEPGIYLENLFGVRLENVVLVVDDKRISRENSRFFTFETLTLCPIDLDLMRRDLLQDDEIRWLNGYHTRVRNTLSPLLGKEEKAWLDKATQSV